MAKKRLLVWALEDKVHYAVVVPKRNSVEIAEHGVELLDQPQTGQSLEETFLRIRAAIPREVRQLEVILSGETIDHELVELPLMNRRETKQLLSRNVRLRSESSKTALAWAWMKVGSSIESGIQKDKVILAIAQQALVSSLVRAAEAAGFKPTRVVTVPFIVQALFSKKLISGNHNNTAVLSLGTTSSHLCLFRRGIFHWYREIPIGTEGVGGESADAVRDPLVALQAEIKRSLMFFYQKFSGESITELYLMSEGPEEQHSFHGFEGLGLTVSVLEAPGKSMTIKDQPYQQSLDLVTGLGILGQRQYLSNLLPQEYFEQRTETSRVLTLASIVGLIFCLLGAGIIALNHSIDSRTETVQALSRNVNRFDDSLDRHQVLLKDFEKYQEQLALIATLPDMGFPALEVLAGLSAAITDDIFIDRLVILNRNRQWHATLEGSFLGTQEATAYNEFALFLSRLDALGFFKDFGLKRLDPRWQKQPQRRSKTASPSTPDKLFEGLDFSVTTELRPPKTEP